MGRTRGSKDGRRYRVGEKGRGRKGKGKEGKEEEE